MDNQEKLKQCSKCKIYKPLPEFYKASIKSGSKDGRVSACVLCSKHIYKEKYAKMKQDAPEKYEQWRNNQAKNRRRNIEFLLNYLQNHPCVDCGEADPIVLEFDHINPSNKKYTIAKAVSRGNLNIENIKQEAEKCVVRCANCHRRKTAKDGNWYKVKLLQNKYD